jgi:hypothetical protein
MSSLYIVPGHACSAESGAPSSAQAQQDVIGNSQNNEDAQSTVDQHLKDEA